MNLRRRCGACSHAKNIDSHGFGECGISGMRISKNTIPCRQYDVTPSGQIYNPHKKKQV